MSEEQNKATNEGEARVLSDDELKGIVGGGGAESLKDEMEFIKQNLGGTGGGTDSLSPSKDRGMGAALF